MPAPHETSPFVEAARRIGSGNRVCLIVDSDPEARRSLEALVQELDVVTVGVPDAITALAMLECCRIDLVMTEESLPGPSGTTLLRAVRYGWPHVARVLVSGNLGRDALMRAVNHGAGHRIVSRHMHAVALRDEIESALNEGWIAKPDCHWGRLTIPPFVTRELVHRAEAPRRSRSERPRLRVVGL